MIEKNDPHGTPPPAGSSEHWERDVLEKLVMSTVTEQRKARRWNILFKSLFLIYLVAVLVITVNPFSEQSLSGSNTHTAVIDITGILLDDGQINADQIIKGLRNAVADEGTRGIILRMNTPGGSPVQAWYVYDEIRRIKKENPDLPLFTVVSDTCASGGYFIAAATDKIFVSKSSIIGSIGVVMNGFGFVETMKKFGVERRLMIAGKNKGLFDAFSPLKKPEQKHLQTMLDDIHQQFIDAVREGRGDRLVDDPSLFSGLVWTGQQGIKMGLADGIGTPSSVAKEIIGEANLVNFTPQHSFLDRFTSKIGTAFEHAFWNVLTNFSLRVQ